MESVTSMVDCWREFKLSLEIVEASSGGACCMSDLGGEKIEFFICKTFKISHNAILLVFLGVGGHCRVGLAVGRRKGRWRSRGNECVRDDDDGVARTLRVGCKLARACENLG